MTVPTRPEPACSCGNRSVAIPEILSGGTAAFTPQQSSVTGTFAARTGFRCHCRVNAVVPGSVLREEAFRKVFYCLMFS